ncbi:chemotaxis protein CheW [Cellulomonas shaoxiangyii]|uniref:Chemotaxis protein CheW n=1 Tax=Cellulomonas shaoxiangyii TaxID=2566013 RepID=A0A4V1CN01_9CELL|nr:chemotaxis protein CheW [Cellulomonas shaoxiangyii]QCB94725.1 chemotaxis protein CheW [Cellulomonas shaoxiangyii]TGY86455.1 chemotaxis protein CheW [Cellulomonas shaoxiangyii]
MSVLTFHRRPSTPLPLGTRLRHLGETIRWAPAPYFEGAPGQRLRFLGYLAGSVLLWTTLTLVVLTALGRALATIG